MAYDPVSKLLKTIIVSSKSHMNTLSVVDSGVEGDTVLVLRPLPLGPLNSDPVLAAESRDLFAFSIFSGECGPSLKDRPFDGLSVNINYNKILILNVL